MLVLGECSMGEESVCKLHQKAERIWVRKET